MNPLDLGLIDFGEAWAIQEQMAAEVAAAKIQETLLLLEHTPVYTIGSGGNDANIIDSNIEAVRINRGGDVTWHGPGQVVGYPLVDLSRRGRDLHRYLRFLEEFLIATAADYGVAACRIPGRTGIWVDEGKLAAIGVGVRRWVTMHGFALNVTNDLAPFSAINPCGMTNCRVTSLKALSNRAPEVGEVKVNIAARFEDMLDEMLPRV
ncbi:MAG: lipoyl(octanoyl) transferase LipB [Geobacter sp.]|nr:lipoyl(octanoyl) transferase LipB [Geobacter sp.]